MTPLLVNSIVMTSCLSENWAMHMASLLYVHIVSDIRQCLNVIKTPKISINLTVTAFNHVVVECMWIFIIASYCPFFNEVICSVCTTCIKLPIIIFSKSFYYDLAL